MIERVHSNLLHRRRALYSECERYRYLLEIVINDSAPVCTFIGLNPSTATELHNDPTIGRCLTYALSWGCGSLRMLNLFAWRDTDPEKMKRAAEPIGPENTISFLESQARHSLFVIAAWGKHGAHLGRSEEVRRAIPDLLALRVSENTGEPWHPLYLSGDLKPYPLDSFSRRRT